MQKVPGHNVPHDRPVPRPVNIHLRDATDDFFAILEECRHLPLRGNVHAFSGSYETFARLQKYGPWKVGIGGVVTYKNAKVAAAVKDIPLESIVLELNEYLYDDGGHTA